MSFQSAVKDITMLKIDKETTEDLEEDKFSDSQLSHKSSRHTSNYINPIILEEDDDK